MEQENSRRRTKKRKKGNKKNSLTSATSIPVNNSNSPEVNYKSFLEQKPPNEGDDWEDDIFPPNEESLLGKNKLGEFIDPIEGEKNYLDCSEIEWKKANEIFPEPYLFEGSINVDNIREGKISNCYFLSAIASLCKYPGLISKIFLTKEYKKNGFYKLLLFIDGEFQIVTIDDNFPCLKDTSVSYFSKANSFELWVLLLEKAWAKVNGGYANIISGYPFEVLKAFTGFACEELIHLEENEEKILKKLKETNENKGIICCSTKNNKEDLSDAGLEESHTYILLDIFEIKDENKNDVTLFKLRNPWGKVDWNGKWSNSSDLWTRNVKDQIQAEKLIPEKGEFFICFDDLITYFGRSDLCHIIFNGFSKTFDFSQSKLTEPQIINFYLQNQANVSVSIMEKNWRYNRQLRDKSHPTSLIIGEYDPNQKSIQKVFCCYESYHDTDFAQKFDPGYYILWIYKALSESEEPLPEFMKVKIISDEQIKIKQLDPDKEFKVSKEIIYQYIKLDKKDEIKDSEVFHDISNDFLESGLGYRIAINPFSNKSQKWEVDSSETKDYSLIPSTQNKSKFSLDLNPNDYIVILAIRNKKYGSFCFNVDVEAEEEESPSSKAESDNNILNNFFLSDINFEEPLTKNNTPSLEELSKKEDYPIVDHPQVFAEKHKDDSNYIKEVVEMESQENEKKLGWIELQKENGYYIGEADYVTPHGRGCFTYKGEGLTYVGYFENGGKGNYGKLYNEDGKLVYEGDYKDGVRNGKGTYYYSNGAKYEGEFVNGLREGNGIFYWEDGSKWEGTFVNNEMDGEGTFYEKEESYPVKYSNGEIVKKSNS